MCVNFFMRIFPCADIRIYGSTLNYGAEIYGSTLNEIILLLLLLLLPRTRPPCRRFEARCAGERAGNGPGRRVPAQWYKKFRVRERTRLALSEKCFGISAANFSLWGLGYRICIYVIDI